MAPPAPSGDALAPGIEKVSMWVRIFVAAFLAAFIACALFRIEAWPLTGWRLFAGVRHDHQTSWQAAVVDSSGAERAVPFNRLPLAYRGYVHVLRGFGRLEDSEKAAVCDAWAEAVRGLGEEVDEIRIYLVKRMLSERQGLRAAPPYALELRFECRAGAVTAYGQEG